MRQSVGWYKEQKLISLAKDHDSVLYMLVGTPLRTASKLTRIARSQVFQHDAGYSSVRGDTDKTVYARVPRV